jgi:hypothetical protein
MKFKPGDRIISIHYNDQGQKDVCEIVESVESIINIDKYKVRWFLSDGSVVKEQSRSFVEGGFVIDYKHYRNELLNKLLYQSTSV